MPEFLHLQTPDEARSVLLDNLPEFPFGTETIATSQALGRVTALPIEASNPLPAFIRSAMDGYAVRAADTFGASDSLPAYLKFLGEISMGEQPEMELQPGEAALIHTGGMLPAHADAVVMLEYTQIVGKDFRSVHTMPEIEIYRAVAKGENVLYVGEDVRQGQVVIPAGRRIRPAEIGGLMALGVMQISVKKPPRVGLISSGDEIVSPEQIPFPGQVRDVNSYTLSAVVERSGGEPVLYGIVPDDIESMKLVSKRALSDCDLVIITAGSSASARDMTAEAIRSLGKPGVLVHGINIRPGKPTILAVCEGKAVIGLPGNPVSALVIASLFVVPVIEKLLGMPDDRPRPSLLARLTINIPSQAGREDWIPVHLIYTSLIAQKSDKDRVPLVEPIFSKSNLIFSLVGAEGLVRIPSDANGLSAGEIVEIRLF